VSGASGSVPKDGDTTVTQPPDPCPPVSPGDQIVGATVYFDKLPSGEAAQLLQSLGQHTLGLRLQRRGDRSPTAGHGCGHACGHTGHGCGQLELVPGSPEVVLVSEEEEEEERRRTGMGMKMRMEMIRMR
uniref:Uncharacterized protein n=1 Tax=Junco hyemalis TaxID=40217 RepID=A0A8C5IE57_JUNHY